MSNWTIGKKNGALLLAVLLQAAAMGGFDLWTATGSGYLPAVGAAFFALVSGAILVFFAKRQTTGILAQLATKMAESAEQVARAAAQVSSASQTLARGASEQAASVEETAGSVHEITTLNHQNAERTGALMGVMKEVGAASRVKDAHMDELVAWVGATHESGQKVAKIIKVIDEIAFQTNVLALNAAVEAARAGEAGSGFAVVADEVRNLAGRSAEAAQKTAALIQESLQGSERGQETVGKCQTAGANTTQLGKRVAQLTSEIAGATAEQLRGIEQIDNALTRIEQITQSAAASAEESASASEELNAQAAEMRDLIGQLSGLV